MNIRSALLKAADLIERRPEQFDFQRCDVPENDCGTPGCAIGWIAYFSGYQYAKGRVPLHADVCPAVLGIHGHEFYRRMDKCAEEEGIWRCRASECAYALRAYAEEYHPRTDHIPASVRALFTEQVAA